MTTIPMSVIATLYAQAGLDPAQSVGFVADTEEVVFRFLDSPEPGDTHHIREVHVDIENDVEFTEQEQSA